jgi:hypothetical protein
MKRRIFMIIAVLPVLLLIGGCGGGYDESQAQYDDDDSWDSINYSLDRQQRSIDGFLDQTDRTMRNQQRDVWQMERDNRDTFNILNSARQQDNMYRQQQRH